MTRLLPVPAPLPARAWGVAVALFFSAAALVLPNGGLAGFPGDPALPYAAVTTNLHWQVHTRGLAGVMADDLHGFPLRTDRVVTDGFPLDALTSWPFTAALGHDVGMTAWLLAVLWAVGLAAAWLGMRWWGTLGAGLVAGVGFQVGEGLVREVAEGRATQAFAALFLPVALGLGVEAARSGRTGAAVGAGLAAALGTLASWGMAPMLVGVAFGPVMCGVLGGLVLGRGAPPTPQPGAYPHAREARARGPGAGDSRPPESDAPTGRVLGPAGIFGAMNGGAHGAPAATASSGPVGHEGGARSEGGQGRRRWARARRDLGTLVVVAAAFVAPLAPVVAWVIAGRGELPSFGMDPWDEAVLGLRQVRPVDLVAARIHGLDGVAVGTLLRPALLVAAGWAAWRGRVRHWGVPVVVMCLGALLGLGSWLPGPAVMPWGWLQALPGLGRLWWADRAWIAVALGLALLAAGVPRRAAPVVAVLVFLEAWFSAALPFPRLPGGVSPAAEVLARAPDVPLVLLPTGEGPFRPDRLDLVDQVHHGRPLANGTRPALDLTGSDAALRGWRNNAGLRALLACEMGGGGAVSDAERTGAGAALVRAGLREVYLDPRYVGADPAYTACVEGVLAGWERNEEPPLVRFRAR